MTETNPAQAPVLAKVVKISPGASSESKIRTIIPADYNVSENSVSNLINYVISNAGDDRRDSEIAERLKSEMQDNYGISINGANVNGNDTVEQYLESKTSPKGQSYLGLDIVVAAKQEGGLEYRL